MTFYVFCGIMCKIYYIYYVCVYMGGGRVEGGGEGSKSLLLREVLKGFLSPVAN